MTAIVPAASQTEAPVPVVLLPVALRDELVKLLWDLGPALKGSGRHSLSARARSLHDRLSNNSTTPPTSR